MIGKDIYKRLEMLENKAKMKNQPFLIIAVYDDFSSMWKVTESFASPYKTKVKMLKRLDDYVLPEGFEGVYIYGKVME